MKVGERKASLSAAVSLAEEGARPLLDLVVGGRGRLLLALLAVPLLTALLPLKSLVIFYRVWGVVQWRRSGMRSLRRGPPGQSRARFRVWGLGEGWRRRWRGVGVGYS